MADQPSKILAFSPLTMSDRRKLDRLIGIALLDAHVRERLLVSRDENLLVEFQLDPQVRRWLLGMQASTLDELARVVCTAAS